MDTHNLATVIAPNILKDRSAIAPMDENSFLAIEAVNSLIEYNDQMSEVDTAPSNRKGLADIILQQVPEDVQSILNDSSLFNNSCDITTKEILRRYGDIGRAAAHHSQITDPSNTNTKTESLPNSHESNTTNGSNPAARAAAPIITHVDTDPYQANGWQKESSVRHVQGSGEGRAPNYPTHDQNTPPQGYNGLKDPNSAYHRRQGSSDSQASHGSAGRTRYRHSSWAKHGTQSPGPMGVAGAG